jgi:hypothetical protein
MPKSLSAGDHDEAVTGGPVEDVVVRCGEQAELSDMRSLEPGLP